MSTTGADPLHLSLVFNISHTTAIRYTSAAGHLLNDELETEQQNRSQPLDSWPANPPQFRAETTEQP